MLDGHEWKALGGIAAVMFGAGFSGFYAESTVAAVAFGLVALAGGIVIIEQLDDAREEVAA